MARLGASVGAKVVGTVGDKVVGAIGLEVGETENGGGVGLGLGGLVTLRRNATNLPVTPPPIQTFALLPYVEPDK